MSLSRFPGESRDPWLRKHLSLNVFWDRAPSQTAAPAAIWGPAFARKAKYAAKERCAPIGLYPLAREGRVGRSGPKPRLTATPANPNRAHLAGDGPLATPNPR